MIGISLNYCVRDLAKGTVQIEDVEYVIAGTAVPDLDWDAFLNRYANSNWKKCGAEKAYNITQTLKAEGKIRQPRMQDDDHYPLIESTAKATGLPKGWVDTLDQIVWQDDSEKDESD